MVRERVDLAALIDGAGISALVGALAAGATARAVLRVLEDLGDPGGE